MKRYLVLLLVLMTLSYIASETTLMPIETPTITGVAMLTGTSTSTGTITSVSTFFPTGFMMVMQENLGQAAAASGVNVAHAFAGWWGIAEAEDYLNQAEAVGLNVIMDLIECRAYESGNPHCEGYSLWSEQEWGEYISTLSTHDNLVAWYLPDEIKDYEVAANLYEWVKRYDPRQRPVYGNPGSFDLEVIQRFPAFADVVWGAWYPEYYGQPRAIVTHGVRLDAAACQGTGTRWGAILQLFDSAVYGHPAGYPSPHELRCDSYQAIIAGATGLWYFDYEDGKDLDGLLAEVDTIADEIIGTGGLDEVILSPDVPQTITKTIISGPTQSPMVQGEVYGSIQTLQKEHQGTYLFAVNITTDTVVVEFSNLQTEADTVEVLFEEGTIPITDDAFRDTFAQNDVHIYFYSPQPPIPLASLAVITTDSPDPVSARATLTYRMVYSNDGPSNAQSVVLTDILPSGVTFGGVASVEPPLFGPTVTLPYLTWYTPTLSAGASGSIALTVTVDVVASGIITNSVVINSSTPDDNLDDNVDHEPTLVAIQIYLPLVSKDQ